MKHFLTSALGVIGAGIAAAFGGWEPGVYGRTKSGAR